MTLQDAARLFHARKRGKLYMAKCTAHPDRSPSLQITAGKRGILLCCMSHRCSVKEICSAVGIQVRDLFYDADSRTAKTVQELRAAEKRASDLRIGEWVLRFMEHGYTRQDRQNDVRVICAAAFVLSHRPSEMWEKHFRRHWERIQAADHCRSMRLLPRKASSRCVAWP